MRIESMRLSRTIGCTALLFALVTPGWTAPAAASGQAQLHGRIVAVHGDRLTLRLRDGRTTVVDITAARAAHHTGILPPGGAIVVYGARDASGLFHVDSIGHTSPDARFWTPDQ
jgi:hypothetical protein